jgi:hypothetical protein
MDSTTNGFDNTHIPPEMLPERRWVAWRYEKRDGKPTKVPINPHTGERASSIDPATWGTYDQATTRAAKPNLDGIGFMLGDGWVGVDFDNYRINGQLRPPVPEAIERFNTYAEVSPSGRGVKIVGRGKLPDGLRNRSPKDPTTGQQIEVYDTARFFTVTGERVDAAPLAIADMPEEFDEFCRKFLPEQKYPGEDPDGVDGPGSVLSDNEILDLLLNRDGERGDELRQMWEGGIPERFAKDDSVADASLVNALVFYTGGDLEQADRLFRQSGLYRDKWERASYRIPTFAFAMSGRGPKDFYGHDDDLEGLLPPPEDLAIGFSTPSPIHEYMREGIEDPPILVKGLLYDGTTYPDGRTEGAVHTWYGEPGCGKSMVALWASVQGMRKGEHVVYIDEEGTKRMITERLTGLGATPEEIEAHFFYYNSPNLTTGKAHQKQLLNIAETLRPGLVIFDSWIDFLANDGRNENSSDEVIGWAMAVSKAFINVGATVLLLDHVTKDGSGRGARGSGGKLGWVMAGHKVTVNSPFDRHTTGEVTFTRQKDREGALPTAVSFTIGGDGTGEIICRPDTRTIRVKADPDGLQPDTRKVLKALPHDGLGHTAWFKATGLKSKATFQKHVELLTKNGLAEKRGTLYIPVTSGPDQSKSGPVQETESVNGHERSSPVHPPKGWTDGPLDQTDSDLDLRANEVDGDAIKRVVLELAASGQQFNSYPAFADEVEHVADADKRDVQNAIRALMLAGEIDPASIGYN